MKKMFIALTLLSSMSSFASMTFPSPEEQGIMATLDGRPIIIAEAIEAQQLGKDGLSQRTLKSAQIFCNLQIPGSFPQKAAYAFKRIQEKDMNVHDSNNLGWVLDFYENGSIKKDLQYLRQGHMEVEITEIGRASIPVAPALLKSVTCKVPEIEFDNTVINYNYYGND